MVAKLFVPSVRCPSCGYANDCDFRFCQRCSYSRKIVSNFGDGDCGAGEIQTHARKFEETRREGGAENFRRSLRVASPRTFARACVFRPPHNRYRQN